MIFTDVLLPDRTKGYFLLDEEASAAVILAELLAHFGMEKDPETENAPGAKDDALCGITALFEDFSGRILQPERTLKEQGIIAGMRLRIGRSMEKEPGGPGFQSREAEDVSVE
ncbi:MAG: EsaB/YukD family protein [Lachnospiraceae bacterium]|nr:EsaB/YukD family protein [Lachnospiraceae bacterium]